MLHDSSTKHFAHLGAALQMLLAVTITRNFALTLT
jgi:hypothetical protein